MTSTSDPADPDDKGKKYLLWSLNHAETLHCHLSKTSVQALCKDGRFDPALKSFAGTQALITNPIVNPMARGKVFEAIKFIFGKRLFIRYEASTHRYSKSEW